MKALRYVFLLGVFVATLFAAFWAGSRKSALPHNQAVVAPAQTAPGGTILGLTIGSTIEEARARLDPLRIPAVHTPDAKEVSGRRLYWKLKETDYDWIMAWGNPAGKIARIRGVFREGQSPAFAQFGDLQAADALSDESAKWNLQSAAGGRYRLIVQGANRRARTVYMFALPFNEPAATAPPEAGHSE